MDRFKQVNDTYSHSIGDSMLAVVARAVSDCVRMDDLVARRGGDEFVVVMHDRARCDADQMLQRIAGAVVEARERVCPELTATASIASVKWQPGQDADELLRAADVALHAKKAEAHRRRAETA